MFCCTHVASLEPQWRSRNSAPAAIVHPGTRAFSDRIQGSGPRVLIVGLATSARPRRRCTDEAPLGSVGRRRLPDQTAVPVTGSAAASKFLVLPRCTALSPCATHPWDRRPSLPVAAQRAQSWGGCIENSVRTARESCGIPPQPRVHSPQAEFQPGRETCFERRGDCAESRESSQ